MIKSSEFGIFLYGSKIKSLYKKLFCLCFWFVLDNSSNTLSLPFRKIHTSSLIIFFAMLKAHQRVDQHFAATLLGKRATTWEILCILTAKYKFEQRSCDSGDGAILDTSFRISWSYMNYIIFYAKICEVLLKSKD